MSEQKIKFTLDEKPGNAYTDEVVRLFAKILASTPNTTRIRAYDIAVDWLTDPDIGLAKMVPSSPELYSLKELIKNQLTIWLADFKSNHSKEDLISLANYLKVNPPS